MKLSRIFLLTVFLFCCFRSGGAQTVIGPRTVIVQSGALQLRALLWQPRGRGPFPAILLSLGSGQNPAPQGLGRTFARRGYVFFALFRSGQGLSANQGEESARVWNRERAINGDDAANRLQLKLLETEQLEQTQQALDYLRTIAFVDRKRVAVLGHSFGGSLALILAERDPSLRAVVTFGAAAGSWPRSSYLRDRLLLSARRVRTPVLMIYAANDFSTTPGEMLDAELARSGKTHLLRIFPAFGLTNSEGHNLLYLSTVWEKDVFAFLDEHVS
jgi:dienelactone hydrolase